MPRARNIKPGFFDNSKLGKLNSDIRLLSIGLSLLADREGILEYDVAEIRRFVFGYRNDITEEMVNGYLTVLSRSDSNESILLRNYNKKTYIIMSNFDVEQNPHHTEKKGKLPSLKILLEQGVTDQEIENTVTSPLSNGNNRALFPTDSGFLIPDLLIPDSGFRIPDSVERDTEKILEEEFLNFWNEFPENGRNKGGRKDAYSKFKIARRKDSFEKILNGVKKYAAYLGHTGQKNADAFRWLEKERWREDYFFTTIVQPPSRKPTADDNFTLGIQQFLSEHGDQ